ncbi:MAG TPA: transporter [Blastocatellia bacterium]|nr:transporter [Blastocatellia bacterium]
MIKNLSLGGVISSGLCVVFFAVIVLEHVQAQVRGVYPPGMSAINSGVTPESGFSYSNLFLFYSRDQLKGPDGEILVTGSNSVMMDMNSFIWVSKREFLGGAKLSLSATLPIANNSLSSDVAGAISGGGGFADSYYQPFILGWQKERAAIRAVYGFLAPTGSFNPTANDNVGSGYWTHVVASGQTFYLTKNKATSVSAFQMYEFHGTQKGTGIRPGQNLDLDYSLMQNILQRNGMRVDVGLVGYGQWQTTDKSGPTITPEQANAHYKVNSLGFASNVMLPERGVSLNLKYFREFSNRSTFQGYSLQISGSIKF